MDDLTQKEELRVLGMRLRTARHEEGLIPEEVISYLYNAAEEAQAPLSISLLGVEDVFRWEYGIERPSDEVLQLLSKPVYKRHYTYLLTGEGEQRFAED